MDSSSWNAQRRKILARVRKAEDKKKMMIQRFFPLKHLISNNIDQVRPLGRWKGACCRWISWLWSTWPVRSELLWGGHNPLIWVLMAFIYLFVFSLSHHVLFGFIRGELLTWTWSFFLNLISLAWVVFVCWWLQQILPTWSTWLTGVWPHHNDLDGDWESARGNEWKRACRHQQGPWAGQVWVEIKSNMRMEIW